MWEEHLKDPIIALDQAPDSIAALEKALHCLENPYSGWPLVCRLLVASRGLQCLQFCRWQDFAKNRERALLGRRLDFLGPTGRLRTASTFFRKVPEKYRPQGELFFFLISKEPVAFSNEVPFKPVVLAETLKACALIGLHLLAAEGEAGSSGSESPELGDRWKYGRRKSPGWISSCSSSETSTTICAELLKSSGRIGRARWWRSFSRIGNLYGWL